jgi:hypothetical protein
MSFEDLVSRTKLKVGLVDTSQVPHDLRLGDYALLWRSPEPYKVVPFLESGIKRLRST